MFASAWPPARFRDPWAPSSGGRTAGGGINRPGEICPRLAGGAEACEAWIRAGRTGRFSSPPRNQSSCRARSVDRDRAERGRRQRPPAGGGRAGSAGRPLPCHDARRAGPGNAACAVRRPSRAAGVPGARRRLRANVVTIRPGRSCPRLADTRPRHPRCGTPPCQQVEVLHAPDSSRPVRDRIGRASLRPPKSSWPDRPRNSQTDDIHATHIWVMA